PEPTPFTFDTGCGTRAFLLAPLTGMIVNLATHSSRQSRALSGSSDGMHRLRSVSRGRRAGPEGTPSGVLTTVAFGGLLGSYAVLLRGDIDVSELEEALMSIVGGVDIHR